MGNRNKERLCVLREPFSEASFIEDYRVKNLAALSHCRDISRQSRRCITPRPWLPWATGTTIRHPWHDREYATSVRGDIWYVEEIVFSKMGGTCSFRKMPVFPFPFFPASVSGTNPIKISQSKFQRHRSDGTSHSTGDQASRPWRHLPHTEMFCQNSTSYTVDNAEHTSGVGHSLLRRSILPSSSTL